MHNIIKSLLFFLIICIGLAHAEWRYITTDADPADWWNVARVQDSDDGQYAHDLQEAALANDADNLYFYFRLDDTPYDAEGLIPDYWGDTASRLEYVTLYIDADNNPLTGTAVTADSRGGTYTLGVEYSLRLYRRDSDGKRSVFLFSGDWNNGGTDLKYADADRELGIAIPDPAIEESKLPYGEARIPFSFIDGDGNPVILSFGPGDTIAWAVWLSRSGDTPLQDLDWLDGDAPQVYEVKTAPTTTHSDGYFGIEVMNSDEHDNFGGFWDYVHEPQFYDARNDNVEGGYIDLLELGIMNNESDLFFYTRIDNFIEETSDPNYPLGIQHWYFGRSSRVNYVDIFIDIDNNPSTGTLVGPAGNQIGAEWTVSSFRRADPEADPSRTAGLLYSGVKTGSNDIPDGVPEPVLTSLNSNDGLRAVTDTSPWANDNVDEWEQTIPLTYEGPEGAYTLSPGSTIKVVALSSRSGDTTEIDWAGPYTYTVASPPELQTLSHFARPTMDAVYTDWDSVPGIKDGIVGRGVGGYGHDLVEVKVCNDDEYLYYQVTVDDTPEIYPYTSSPWLTVTPWNEVVPHDQFGYGGKVEYIGVYFDTDNNPATGDNPGVSTAGGLAPLAYDMGIEYVCIGARRYNPLNEPKYTRYALLYERDKMLDNPEAFLTGWADDPDICDYPNNLGIALSLDHGPTINGSYLPKVLTGVKGMEHRIPLSYLAKSLTDPFPMYPPIDPEQGLKVGDTIQITVKLTRSGGTGIMADDALNDWLDYPFYYTIAAEPAQCGEMGYPQGDVNKDCYTDIADLDQMAAEWLNTTNP
jgi:hypothetical protein